MFDSIYKYRYTTLNTGAIYPPLLEETSLQRRGGDNEAGGRRRRRRRRRRRHHLLGGCCRHNHDRQQPAEPVFCWLKTATPTPVLQHHHGAAAADRQLTEHLHPHYWAELAVEEQKENKQEHAKPFYCTQLIQAQPT